jgi:multiple sugar transport system permease protein
MASSVEAARAAPRRRRATLAQQESRTGFALVSPTLAVVLVMVVLPVLWTILLALQRVRLSGIRSVDLLTGPYVLRNFDLIVGSPEFWTVLRTTLAYTIGGTIGSIALGLAAALLVRSSFRGRTIVRAAMLLPWVAPIVAVAFAWQVLLSPQFGLLNAVGTDALGWADPIPFLSQEHGELSVLGVSFGVPTALLTVIAFEAWRYFPFAFLFLAAALTGLPREIEEAAVVDGASAVQRFRHVVLPQLMPTVALLALLRLVMTFNKFDDVYLLTGGAAGTEVAAVRVYDRLTGTSDIGGASADAVVLAVLLAAALFFYLRISNRRREER